MAEVFPAPRAGAIRSSGHDCVGRGLMGKPAGATTQEVADGVGLDLAVVHRAFRRLQTSQLILSDRRVQAVHAEEFLVHGLRYVFPPEYGGASRGVPTAWAVSPLRERFASDGSLPPVWPHPQGAVRGIAVEPLHKAVPSAALADPALHARLAVVDALRLGDARQCREARELLLPMLVPAGGVG